MNAARGTMKVAAIKAPRYGEERRAMLHDLALSTGATYVSRVSGMKLKDVKLENLGSATKIESYKNKTTIAGGKGDWEKIEERIETYKEELKPNRIHARMRENPRKDHEVASGIAIIRVGAATEIEMIEKKHRIEDALEAVKSAQLEGIVPGGGTALIRAIQGLDSGRRDRRSKAWC
jgi:chaperonin GroEL